MKASTIAGFTPEAKSRQERVKKLKLISDRLVKLSSEFDAMLNASSMQYALGNASNGSKKLLDSTSKELEMIRKLVLDSRAKQIKEMIDMLDGTVPPDVPDVD